MMNAVVLRSVVAKNVLLFLVILVVAVLPLSWQYYRDSRDYEIQNLASKLEFFAERGASWLDVPAVATITGPEHATSPAYTRLLEVLNRIKTEFDVDNAVVLRRDGRGRYVYVAIDHGGFAPGDEACNKGAGAIDVTPFATRPFTIVPGAGQ